MSKYQINYRNLVGWLIPKSLRGGFVALAWVMTHGVRVIHQRFLATRDGHWLSMSYNCQYPKLQKLLNDKLDPLQRRIRVCEAGGAISTVVVYPNLPNYVHPNVGCLVVHPWTQYIYPEFEVILPSDWSDQTVEDNKLKRSRVNRLVGAYKITGTYYIIKYQ